MKTKRPTINPVCIRETPVSRVCGVCPRRHKILGTALHSLSNPRGPGFWKLNTSFLTDKDNAAHIRTVIAQVREEYKNDANVNDAGRLLWEIMKLKIREKSMQYVAAKKAKMSRKEEELEKIINALQNLVDSNRIREKQSALNELEDKRTQLEEIVDGL